MVYSKNLWGSSIKKIVPTQIFLLHNFSSCFLCFICPHSSSHSSFLLFFIPPLTPLFFKEYLFCSSSLLLFSSPHSPLQHLPSPSRSFFFHFVCPHSCSSHSLAPHTSPSPFFIPLILIPHSSCIRKKQVEQSSDNRCVLACTRTRTRTLS